MTQHEQRLPLYMEPQTGIFYAVETIEQALRKLPSEGDNHSEEYTPPMLKMTPVGPRRREGKPATWIRLGEIDRDELDR